MYSAGVPPVVGRQISLSMGWQGVECSTIPGNKVDAFLAGHVDWTKAYGHLVTISTMTILLACLVMAIFDVLTFRRSMALDLGRLADLTADNSTAAVNSKDQPSAREVLRALRAQPHVIAACTYSQNGTVFASY